MKFTFLGAVALAASSPLFAQTGSTDLTYANPLAGSWHYASVAGGSEATFSTPSGAPQLTIRCMRGARRVQIEKPAAGPSSSLWVWTSLQARNLPATFDAATGQVRAELPMLDNLLDAMASSRGRLGFTTPGVAPLVLPAWGDVARVVEDCRA